jgi:hypothetical protein
MAFSTVELNQDLIVVITDIACVWQAAPALLAIAGGSP